MDTRASIPERAADNAALVWYISFGDLLTLLVCFFLVLTSWQGDRRTDPDGNQSVGVIQPSLSSDGTPLAKSSVGQKWEILDDIPLLRSHIEDWSDVRRSEFVSGIDRRLREQRCERARIVLRVCGDDAGERVMRAVGPLMTGLSENSQPVMVEATPTCKGLGVYAASADEILGSVRIIREL